LAQDISHSATPALNDAQRVPAPRRLGRYRILDEVATGGMATLYLGATEGVGGYQKIVALKRIHPHLAKDQRYLDMFLDEARLAARIVHPNVCSVIDFGEAENEHFLAMEFLSGVSLAEFVRAAAKSPELRQDPRWLSVIGRCLVDAAEGLHAAHEVRDGEGKLLQVVHRDVSPQNLLVGFDGVTRVLDFGVAAAADRIHHTQTGEVKGKFAYMAPEQVKQGAPDRRIDVWALGVVAWEAMSMRRLFKRDGTASTLYAVLEESIQPLSIASPGIPRPLDIPVMEALRRDRDRRTPTTRAFGTALREALERAGRSLAEPSEVAAFLARAMPNQQEVLRARIAAARARVQDEPTEMSQGALVDVTIESPPLPPRVKLAFAALALVCLAAIGIAGASWLRESPTPPPVATLPPLQTEPRQASGSVESAIAITPPARPPEVTTATPPPVRPPSGRRPPRHASGGGTSTTMTTTSMAPDIITEW
jgi:serine/threonine-protein kinase